jgi:hypothetical protein
MRFRIIMLINGVSTRYVHARAPGASVSITRSLIVRFVFVSEPNTAAAERDYQTQNRKRNVEETDQHTRGHGNDIQAIRLLVI